jgi:2-keto-4-pentenoate hydratase/2-oxohepta-3-ene-1,7-dioic acid hydratase in catechol pathway
MNYALANVTRGGKAVAVIEVGGATYRLDRLVPDLLEGHPSRGLMALFSDWEAADKRLGDIARGLGPASPARLDPAPGPEDFLTPLQFPNKLMLGGANYYEHMRKEANKPDFRKEDGTPVFFLKPPTTSLVGCGKTVLYPVQSEKFDWEIELAVIIGKRMRRASEEEATAGIAGYAVGLDLSARDWQMNPRHPWKFDLFAGKAFDTSCPVGPKIVPARFVDPKNLDLRLWINGVLKQDANTSDMIWGVAEQISILSEHVTLEPGDIVLTGTPAGVGMASGTYLKVGDRIDAEITGLGRLSVEIMPDERSPRTPRPG